MQKITKAIAFAMAPTLVMVMLPAFAAVFHSDVRVKLSIGSGRSFTFTPVGEYTLKEAGSSVGTDELTVEAVGSRVSIKLGDKTYTGPSHAAFKKLRQDHRLYQAQERGIRHLHLPRQHDL